MSINNENANKYICYLAHNIWEFAYWVENEWPKEIANKQETYKENKL